MKKLSFLLTGLILLPTLLTGCSSLGNPLSAADDLMANVTARRLATTPDLLTGENAVTPTDFAVRLFQACLEDDRSTVISPVSVLYALSMTANGAGGNTLAQMDSVLGMDVSTRNDYLRSYRAALPTGEKSKLHIANSIWFTEDESLTVRPEFLQANADSYGADIYQLPFDHAALGAINGWVDQNTDGMIPSILDELSPDTIMVLVNAVAFDAQWQKVYEERQVWSEVFTTEAGVRTEVDMLHSSENMYLETDNATGFVKYYAGADYAFAALLPNEGVTVRELAEGLTGAEVTALLSSPQYTTVDVTMPKFESTYDVEMTDILMAMGMPDAFDGNAADFSGIGTSTKGNLFIAKALHKAYIAVDEQGTKAGAATAVVMETTAAMPPEDKKEVILDRPFVYMIFDREAKLPLFIGTVMTVEG